MHRLSTLFGEQIDFVNLNIDDSSTQATRDYYGFRGRKEYVLVDENDQIVQRWFGPLDQQGMIDRLQTFLDERG